MFLNHPDNGGSTYLSIKIKMQIYYIAIVVLVIVSDLSFFSLEVAVCA